MATRTKSRSLKASNTIAQVDTATTITQASSERNSSRNTGLEMLTRNSPTTPTKPMNKPTSRTKDIEHAKKPTTKHHTASTTKRKPPRMPI